MRRRECPACRWRQRGSMSVHPVGFWHDPGDPCFTGDPYSVSDSVSDPTDAVAGIELDVDGGVEGVKSSGNQGDIGRWDCGSTLDMSDFDFRVDTISGSLNHPSSNAADTWISGGSLIFFAVERTFVGTQSFSGTLRIRPSGGGSDIDTASLSLDAEVIA